MATAIRMPQLGMIMTEGTLAKWHKEPGAPVKQGDPLAEITTEKISYELEAPESGIFHPAVNEGDVVPIEQLIAHILQQDEPVPEPPSPKPVPVSQANAVAPIPGVHRAQSGPEVRAAPSARKLAARLGIDITQVLPARPGGRIVEADVKAYAESRASASTSASAKTDHLGLPPGLPTPSKIEPLAGIRKAIASNMRRSVSNAAQLSFHIEVDMTAATALRKERGRGEAVSLSTADVVMKACADALLKNPRLNTILSDGKVYYFEEINIGLAVALNDGLIVPVIRNAEAKSIKELAAERKDLSERARSNKLKSDELTGGTFSLTVLGTVDGFTPLLYPGQSAILGVGRIAKKPVVVGDEIVVREMTTISLTVDHQVVDGAPASAFLRRVKQLLEHPEHLFY